MLVVSTTLPCCGVMTLSYLRRSWGMQPRIVGRPVRLAHANASRRKQGADRCRSRFGSLPSDGRLRLRGHPSGEMRRVRASGWVLRIVQGLRTPNRSSDVGWQYCPLEETVLDRRGRYTLQQLIDESDPDCPRSADDEAWLEMGSVGLEIVGRGPLQEESGVVSTMSPDDPMPSAPDSRAPHKGE